MNASFIDPKVFQSSWTRAGCYFGVDSKLMLSNNSDEVYKEVLRKQAHDLATHVVETTACKGVQLANRWMGIEFSRMVKRIEGFRELFEVEIAYAVFSPQVGVPFEVTTAKASLGDFSERGYWTMLPAFPRYSVSDCLDMTNTTSGTRCLDFIGFDNGLFVNSRMDRSLVVESSNLIWMVGGPIPFHAKSLAVSQRTSLYARFKYSYTEAIYSVLLCILARQLPELLKSGTVITPWSQKPWTMFGLGDLTVAAADFDQITIRNDLVYGSVLLNFPKAIVTKQGGAAVAFEPIPSGPYVTGVFKKVEPPIRHAFSAARLPSTHGFHVSRLTRVDADGDPFFPYSPVAAVPVLKNVSRKTILNILDEDTD